MKKFKLFFLLACFSVIEVSWATDSQLSVDGLTIGMSGKNINKIFGRNSCKIKVIKAEKTHKSEDTRYCEVLKKDTKYWIEFDKNKKTSRIRSKRYFSDEKDINAFIEENVFSKNGNPDASGERKYSWKRSHSLSLQIMKVSEMLTTKITCGVPGLVKDKRDCDKNNYIVQQVLMSSDRLIENEKNKI